MTINLATMSAAALLGVPADRPERLFKGSVDDVKKAYRLLAMRWHPDRSSDPDARAVFQHIGRMVELVEEQRALGVWPCCGTVRFAATDGRAYEINYLRRHRFELGTMYVASTVVAFEVDRDHADLVANAERAIKGCDYANAKMREQIASQLPAFPFAAAFQTAKAYVIVMHKTPDVLLLRDVLDHFGGRLNPRHVAWVVSALLNLCCYFQHAGTTHNALSLDTCFMSPPGHRVAILGGWWYAAPRGARMFAAPASTIKWGPHGVLDAKKADVRTDLELVRAIGRELLGDSAGAGPVPDHAVPQAMVDWLRMPATADPVDEYRTWQTRVLHDSFGARRFAELPLTQSDLYR